MVSPGFSFTRLLALTPIPPGARRRRRSVSCARRPAARPARLVQRQHAGREQRGVDGASLADRECADRDAGRHLHDGVEQIHACQRLGFDGDAEHRKLRHRCGHARQMRRAAGTRDDDLVAGRLRALGKREQPVRRTVRRHDALVAVDPEFPQRLGGVPHGVPVGLASHDDGDGSGHWVNSLRIQKVRPIIGSDLMTARRGREEGMHYPVLVNPGKSEIAG